MEEDNLDIRGMVCPQTVIKVLQKVRAMEENQKLVILTDAETATNSIPKEMKKKGLDCKVEHMGPGEWKLIITKEVKA